MITNSLLTIGELPDFAAFRPEEVTPALDQLLSEARAAVALAETVTPVTWETFVMPMEETGERLGRAWGLVSHLKSVGNSPELRAAHEQNLPKLTAFDTETGQNARLLEQYRKLAEALRDRPGAEVKRRVVENVLREFRLGGAELPEAQKARYGEIRQELAQNSAKFAENVLDATDAYRLTVQREQLAGVPEEVLAAVKDGEGAYRLTLQMPCYQPVMMYAEDRELRRTLYRASVTRASEFGPPERDNTALMDRLVRLRGELSRLLEFASYGDFALTASMAKTPAATVDFLRDLARRALPHAQRDKAELERYAREKLGLAELESWDTAYASEKLKEAEYDFSPLEVKQYLTETKVLAGLFGVMETLYGVRAERTDAPVWHPDVRFYELRDVHGASLGHFYLDLYAREGKRGGAWMNSARNRRRTATGVQTPLVYLVCNFGKGVEGREATFTHQEVTTLFHEMGHGLHQLLTEVDEVSVAGISGVEHDAIELPSQFMENFCWEWKHLESMTAHVETGAPMPKALFDKMLAAKNFESGMAMVRQLEFALFDMLLHSEFDPDKSTVVELLDKVRAEVAVLRPPAWNRFPQQFSHIFAGGYAAGYYSYKWAEVLSADAYAAFEEAPEQVRETGRRFRREVLARGGSRDARESFVAFRGREPEVDALLRHNGMAG